jgi:oligopeptide/dipeptide ABC transporter ATP-binding protein
VKRVATSATADGSAVVAAPVERALVEVRDLRVDVATTRRTVPLVQGVSLAIASGETVGLVGESGSGKSVTAMALARLLSLQLAWSAEVLDVAGNDLRDPAVAAPRRTATDIGVVFQDPASCFNPALRLGTQLTEVAQVHRGLSRTQATEEAIRRLTEVRISDPARRMRQYPHELSGGMRQRAMIAMALMSEPRLLIADEPTTALDVTVQADVLRLMKSLSLAHEMAMLLISHDINVVATMCDRVYVMYAGRIVEEVVSSDLRAGSVKHPYTKALLAAAIDSHVDVDLPLVALPGRPPHPGEPGAGCAFASRCPIVMERCRTSEPPLTGVDQGKVACHAVTLEPTVGVAR